MPVDIHRCRFVDYNPHTISALSFTHKSNVKKFAPNELRLAVGRNNGDIEIWNPKKWIHEFTMYGGKDRSIEGLVWCTKDSESPRLFSIGGSTFVTEWDLKTGLPLIEVDSNSAMIWSIAINQSQDKLALGCDDGTVVILDISGGAGSIEHSSFLQRQDSRVLSLAWKGDEFVFGGCADGKIKAWNVETKSLVASMRVDKSKKESTLIWSVTYLPKLDQIVSGDSTGSVKFWQVENYTLLQTFSVHDADILTLTCDADNENLFSAGVDRKIYKFQHTNNKWMINSNRLFHSNDIRSMASYQSKNYQFLVSGGVEKSIVVNPIKTFIDGHHKKISPFPQHEKVVFNDEKRLIAMWSDNLVKIWKLVDKSTHKLVAKMTLTDDENISTVAFSPNGEWLVIGRLTTTKLFRLQEVEAGKKLNISKASNELLLAKGSTNLKFFGNDSIILSTPEAEIYQVSISEEDEPTEIEYDLPESAKKSKLPFLSTINNLVIHNSKLLVSRIGGAIDIIDLETKEVKQFLRLSTNINKLQVIQGGNLIVITADNKIYEFDLKDQHLTPWSTKNTEFLPYKYLSQDPPVGVFYEHDKLWVYGADYLSFFDLKLDISVTKFDRKRKYSSVIGHIDISEQDQIQAATAEDAIEDDDDEVLIDDVDLRSSNQLDFKTLSKDKLSYWMSHKYKPLLFVTPIESLDKSPQQSKDLLVVERPNLDTAENSFKLRQYRI
ncbi:hypothetical protein WICPIJ_006615 [Wickerhamomyces pijperi]|uniref:Anaphase-promoting complex subunit 4 WD40 domain-containing protein n=1 Tax=Wickerhamomyces pijperi TaxID=599730 RepID=A0A9P8TKU0_WICPI|nr:hypothetical protein WICPIJ_006615 [Wickerhamomyces pijperi]